jgi:hypothetical protein
VLNRRVAPLLAAFSVVALAVTGCADQAAAVRVGSSTHSDAQLRDELDAYAENDALWEATGQSADAIRGELASSYDQQFVGQILQQRVTFMLGERIFDDEDLDLTDDERQAAAEQLDEQLGGALRGFPESFRDDFLDDVARLNSLQNELGAEGLDEALRDAADTTDIEVSSRYGHWDADRYAVVPPDGPTPAPLGADDATDPFGG